MQQKKKWFQEVNDSFKNGMKVSRMEQLLKKNGNELKKKGNELKKSFLQEKKTRMKNQRLGVSKKSSFFQNVTK